MIRDGAKVSGLSACVDAGVLKWNRRKTAGSGKLSSMWNTLSVSLLRYVSIQHSDLQLAHQLAI